MPLTMTDLFAVRDNVDMRDKESHRLVACLALDDIISRGRQRMQWTHLHTARVLGVPTEFTDLLDNYLLYRHTSRTIRAEKGLRPHGATCAQLFVYDDNRTPLDLINLGTSGDRAQQMAKILSEATFRKLLVDPDAVKDIESMLSRSCGMAWDTIITTFRRQLAAQQNCIPSTPPTTAMEAKAA
jgi:hypothetical protein